MQPPRHSHAHSEPAEADIRKCAYFLWQEEGSPTGRDLDIWLKAREFVRHHVPRPAERIRPARPRPRA